MTVIDWAALDHEVPLLLLPVRLETQTEPVPADAPEDTPVRLRVRIYPDDVGLDPDSGRPLLLPDAFVVVARVGDDVVAVAEGRPVTLEHVGLGQAEGTADERLDALAGSLRALTRHEGAGTGAEWLWSYEAAVDLGMAVTLELPPGTERVDTLVVLGARVGRTPDDESMAVTEALRAHGGDTGFLRAGDPTNNTESGRSAWSRPGAGSGSGRPPAPLGPGAAAARLAWALGDPDDPLEDWVGADDPGERWAEAMATALWPVTWGTFLTRSVRRGTLHPDRIEAVRHHHRAAVRGRGPLPPVRLGRQPYGVLPVTDIARVSGVSSDVDALAGLLDRAAVLWRLGARSVPAVPRDGIRALPEVLGQAPVSWGLRARRVLGSGGALAEAIAQRSFEQAQARGDLTAVFESLLGLPRGSFADPDLLGVDRTLGLPLVADDDPDSLAALAEGGFVTGSSVLQVLLGLALSSVRTDLDARLDGPPLDGEHQRFRRAFVLLDHLGGRLRELLGEEAADVSREVLDALVAGDPREDLADLAEHAIARADETQVAQGRLARWTRPLAALDPAFRPEDADGLLDELLGLLRAVVLWHQVHAAVRTLAGIGDPAERRGLLAETLDCTSHRHDAWATSVATARLAQLRSDRRTGVAVGAFGVVEDLALVRRHRPADAGEPGGAPDVQPAGRGGVVHAPSLAHAATAAVLRGGRLAHAPGDEADRALEMDLSSTRAREAREVLAGMRAGQELGALLGYRFERWLAQADLALNRFVASLRALAPTVAAKEVDRVAEGIVDLGVEVVAASQVVDGVRLLDLDRAGVRTALGRRPAALARYDAPWPPPTDAQWHDVEAALDRLGGLLDAVGDLLLAEGVHQVVAGNAAGAAAAMDALSGDGLPPEPEVVATPQDRAGLSHRVVVLLPHAPGPAAADGWSATPRALANPRLEAWCRLVLGPASRVVVATDGAGVRTLRTVRVAALDLVEAAGGGRLGLDAFWARTRRARPGLPEQPLGERPDGLAPTRSTLGETWQLAATVHAVLAAARALEPGDVVHDVRADTTRATPSAPGPADPWRADLHTLVERLSGLATAAPATPGQARRVADDLADFGIGDATPVDDELLAMQLPAAQREAGERVAAATALLAADATAADVATAAQRLTGSELPVPLPLDPPGPPEPFSVAWEADDGSRQHGIRPWLARHARVRTAVHGYTEAAMLRAAARRRVPLRAVTLDADGWLGEQLPDAVAPASAHTSLVVEAAPGVHPGEGYSGLVVDGWHETLPRRRVVPDDTTTVPEAGEAGPEPAPDPAPEEVATTGLAVHANGPDARAPQVFLLGVTPDREPWTQERVLRLVDTTLALARQRLVPLERLPLAASLLPAATVAHWSLQGERVLDPRILSTLADPSAMPRFVRFDG